MGPLTPVVRDLLQHVLDDDCSDPDCEIHQIAVGLDEETVTAADLAFFLAGAFTIEKAIIRHFDRMDAYEDQHQRLLDACRYASAPLIALSEKV